MRPLHLFLFNLLLLALSFSHGFAQDPPTPPAGKEVPNIFTPNGDGVNDNLTLQSDQGKTLTIIVINRNGGEVYRRSAQRIVWDGTNDQGVALPDGIYFYQLDDPANEYVQHKGFIYIARGQ